MTQGFEAGTLACNSTCNGFDTSKVPETVDADLFAAESGKGLVLMKSFANELTFNAAGNEVTMVKKCC